MKVKKFDSFSEYDAWTETFDNAADYQMIPTIIDDGWKVSIDLFIECKKAKTAIRRFISTFSEYFPDVKDWGDGMLESIEAGYWHSDSHGYQDAEEERRIANTFGAFSWGVEETMEGVWYIYLNVSGEYAGRGQKVPAAHYMEQVEQADSLGELDSITETAANDDTISTADYETIHAAALRKAQSWGPQNKREGITSSTGEYEKYAHVVAEAIRTLASKPDNLENLESYLSATLKNGLPNGPILRRIWPQKCANLQT